MAIKFDYAVIYNGKYYPANTPIEEAAQEAVEAAQSADNAKTNKESDAEVAPAKKATKPRKKAADKA